MPLMFHRGRPLFVNGQLAMSEDCCCDESESDSCGDVTEVLATVYMPFVKGTLPGDATCDTALDYEKDIYISASFASSGGQTASVSGIGEAQIQGDPCGVLSIDGEVDGFDHALVTIFLRTSRAGTLVISGTAGASVDAECVGDELEKSDLYHSDEAEIGVSIDNVLVSQDTHPFSWDANTGRYTSNSYTKTVQVPAP